MGPAALSKLKRRRLPVQTLPAVEKAIREGPLGLNPYTEGGEVLVPVPK